MPLQPVSSVACPEHFQLLALIEGTLPDEQLDAVAHHVSGCPSCDARLDQIEEQSDTLIRSLASAPASPDDEETFQRLQADLLDRPESFLGDANTEATQALSEHLPMQVILPFRLGNYELLEQIGAGAHGAVFRGLHCRLEREVAVKLLLRPAGPFVTEFLNEMRVVGQLDHPNIIRATDAGEQDGTYFLVMEFVPGLDVSSLLRRTGPLSVPNACEIARQTALGLSFAHQHQLVHRDVKTSNLLLVANGQIKLLDLGLATIPTPTDDAGIQPRTGPRGTADYMAPEQWREASSVTQQADLYSLGCTMFKLLTGSPPYRELPFGVNSKEQAHTESEIPSLVTTRNDVPAAIDKLVTELLAKSPHDRPASANEVADRLSDYVSAADLSSLVRNHCPELVQQNDLKSIALSPMKRSGRRKPISRRAFLLGSGATIVIAAAAMRFRDSKVLINTSNWRPLVPSNPPIIVLGSIADSELREENNQYHLESTKLGLLHLGHPIANRFRWRTELEKASWVRAAGVFFGFRKTSEQQMSFQSLELQSSEDSPQSMLLWCTYRNPDADHDPFVLAETPCVSDGTKCALEVVLGRSGFPEVIFNGVQFPQSQWTLSKEARDIVAASSDKIPSLYAGRIGVLQRGGTITTKSSQIMYLKN